MFATPKGPDKIIIECMQLKPRNDMHISLQKRQKKKKRKEIFEERRGGVMEPDGMGVVAVL